MTYVESYLNQISNEEIKKSVLQTIKDVVPEHIENFSFREHVTGLLLGNVQSGKTGQMLRVSMRLLRKAGKSALSHTEAW